MNTDKTPTITTIDTEAVAPVEEEGAEALELEKRPHAEGESAEGQPAPDVSDEEWRTWAREGADLIRRKTMYNAAMVETSGARTPFEKFEESMRRLGEAARRAAESMRRLEEVERRDEE